MNPRDPNVQMVEQLIVYLDELANQFVFVGGCAAGLLITDPARPPVRATTDVDLVAELTTLSDYYRLTDQLRGLGFSEDPNSKLICRWRIKELKVDILPTSEKVFGFSNRWYQRTTEAPTSCNLPSGATIKLISSPLFLATKLEAFSDRGHQDFGASHDMEDIIAIIDGRPEIVGEVSSTFSDVKGYLREEFDGLLSEQRFTESISWHLQGDLENQSRVPIIIERMRLIAGL